MKRLVDRLAIVEGALALALMAFVVATNTVQVFWRSALSDPLSWTEEAARVAFIWLVYVGVARAVRRRSHISVDFFVRLMPDRLQVAIDWANRLLYVAFFALFFALAIQLTLHTSAMSLAVLPLPAATIYAAGVFSGALSLIYLVAQLVAGPQNVGRP